jgi:hypothetical protein
MRRLDLVHSLMRNIAYNPEIVVAKNLDTQFRNNQFVRNKGGCFPPLVKHKLTSGWLVGK